MLDYFYGLGAPRRQRRQPVRRGRIARRQDQCIVVGKFEGDLAGGYTPPQGYRVVRTDDGMLYYCPAGVQPGTPGQTGNPKPKPQPKPKPKPKKWNAAEILKAFDAMYSIAEKYNLPEPSSIGITNLSMNTGYYAIKPGVQEESRRKANAFANELFKFVGVPMYKAGMLTLKGEAAARGFNVEDTGGMKAVMLDRTPGSDRTVGMIYMDTYNLLQKLKKEAPIWRTTQGFRDSVLSADDPEEAIVGLFDTAKSAAATVASLSEAGKDLGTTLNSKMSALKSFLSNPQTVQSLPNAPRTPPGKDGRAAMAKSLLKSATSAAQGLTDIAKRGTKATKPVIVGGYDSWDWISIPPKPLQDIWNQSTPPESVFATSRGLGYFFESDCFDELFP